MPSKLGGLRGLLFDSDIDISLARVDRGNPSSLSVRHRTSPVRMAIGAVLLIPCVSLLKFAMGGGLLPLLLGLMFIPPIAGLAVIVGLGWQQKTFERGTATKSYGVLNWHKSRSIELPLRGCLETYRTFNSFDSGGCYFYHVGIKGIPGLGFSIAKNEHARDELAKELAAFLGYEIVQVSA